MYIVDSPLHWKWRNWQRSLLGGAMNCNVSGWNCNMEGAMDQLCWRVKIFCMESARLLLRQTTTQCSWAMCTCFIVGDAAETHRYPQHCLRALFLRWVQIQKRRDGDWQNRSESSMHRTILHSLNSWMTLPQELNEVKFPVQTKQDSRLEDIYNDVNLLEWLGESYPHSSR